MNHRWHNRIVSSLFVIALLLAGACGGGDKTPGGTVDAGAEIDGANSLTCQPTQDCFVGPSCGDTCCSIGEQCVNGECLCGSSPACTGGDLCATAGPVGDDGCGTICCGQSGPCPQ